MQIQFSNPILERALRSMRSQRASPRLTLAGVGGLWLACAILSLTHGSAALFASPPAMIVRQIVWLTPMLTFWLAGVIAARETRTDTLKTIYQSPLTDERIITGYGLVTLLRLRGLITLAVGLLPALAYGSVSLGIILALCLLALHGLAALAGVALGLRWGGRYPRLWLLVMPLLPALLLMRGLNVIAPDPSRACLLAAESVRFQSNFLRLRWLAPAPLPELGLLALLVGLCFVAMHTPVRESRRLRPRLELAGGLLALLLLVGGDVWLTTRVERGALVAIYHASNGDTWRDNDLWLTSAPVCNWENVRCSCGYVSGLSVRLGTLPPAVGRLTNLRRLELQGSWLADMPPQFGRLTHLRTLVLKSTSLTTLPPEIRHVAELRALTVIYSDLERLPPEIGRLSQLETLYLHNNHLAEIPPEMGNLTHAHTLHLSDNQLSTLPPEIAGMSELTALNLEGSGLTALSPEFCARMLNVSVEPPELCGG